LETIVFNLVHNIDVLETSKRIDEYKKSNHEQIAKAKARHNPGLLELEALLEEEKLLVEHRIFESLALEKDEKVRKLKTKEALIDDLMFSDTDAGVIMASHKSQQEKQEQEELLVQDDLTKRRREIHAETAARLNMIKAHGVAPPSRPQFSTGITAGITGGFLPVPKKTQENLFTYEEPVVFNNGPQTPTFENLISLADTSGPTPFGRLVRKPDRSSKGGGYHPEYEVRRALSEAFSDILFNPKTEAAIKCYPFAPDGENYGMDVD